MTLTDTFKQVHRWSGQTRPRVDAETACMNFVFDGRGSPVVAGGRFNITVGIACRIVRATILADVTPATATFVLLHGTYLDFPSLLPIYTLPIQQPTLLVTDLYKTECNLVGWETKLQIQDTMICVLESITGGVTSITLALQLRRFPAGVR